MTTTGKIALFVGGTFFGSAGFKLLGSKDARKVYTHATAAVLRCKDQVMRDVEAGAVMMGSPCVPFKDFMRQVAFLQKNSKK